MKRRSFVLALVLALTTSAVGQAQSLEESTRLAALGRVWGLLKYFHQDVIRGPADWDAALIQAVPRVRAAATHAQLNDEIDRLIRAAGPMPRAAAGAPVDRPESDPQFAWLDDGRVFTASIMQALKTIRHSTRSGTNRYVRPFPNVLNPDFSTDVGLNNDTVPYPNTETRLLALFRYWNMVQYYFPYRDVMDRPWQDVLEPMAPRFVQAQDAPTYHALVAELTSSINDSHSVTSSTVLTQHWGPYILPVQVRYIESRTVVTRVMERYRGGADLRVGDVITSVNGVATGELRSRLRKYMPASNENVAHGKLNGNLLRGPSAAMTAGVLRDGVERTITVTAPSVSDWNAENVALDAEPPKWRMLDSNVGYVNMGRLLQADVTPMMNELRNTRAIVFDSRNYPNSTLYLLAQQLNAGPREFVKINGPDYANPGSLVWIITLNAGPTAETTNYYRGRVIILADERTQSQAEFTMMALKTAPDVVVVGSQTSGADGNISLIRLPGGIGTYFSGIGIFYPDGSPTQRVGIVPDVTVEPTIQGIRNGVDEVLQRALQLVPR